MRTDPILIKEYDSLISGRQLDGFFTLPEHTFSGLEQFILSSRNGSADPLDLMGISVKKGVGKVITAKNYVGVITMKDGTSIEILPKIYSETGCDERQTKRLLLKMLRPLLKLPYKSVQMANVDAAKMNVLEIFIRMFIHEVFALVKRGLKCDYQQMETNSTVFKGKLLVSQHVRYNYARKNRAYIAFDEFDPNRLENRLIKSTLLCLYRQTTSAKNKIDLRTLLNVFEGVSPSGDWSRDFSRIVPDRNMADYNMVLSWCRVFLEGKSFTSFSGSEVACALLFPMETLFERYLAELMRKKLSPLGFQVSAQDKRHHLFERPSKAFLLKPDIVVTCPGQRDVVICDTKWKLLSGAKPNYGITQADMYQIYAYQKKYGAKLVVLLYPMCDGLSAGSIPMFDSGDGVMVKIGLIDLLDVQRSLDEVISVL